MAAKATQDIGTLLKEARNKAGLSQASLADSIDGLSAGDISKAERGEKLLSDAQVKEIAKLCGVTQTSLVTANKAAREKAEKGSGKTSSSTSKKKKTSSAKKPASSSSKDSDEYKLTNAEKTLIDLYRKADSDTKKEAVRVLKGEKSDMENIINSIVGAGIDILSKKADGK